MNTLQRAAWRRKGLYYASIIALFTISMFWRGSFALGNPQRIAPAPTALHKAADWLGSKAIEPQAIKLELRELDQGDPELAGEMMRHASTGARGFAIAYLWRELIESQKRGELAHMEMLVRMTTKLQPHFLSPWLFQSWNITYNVSVDQHRLGDMYFYIARGIDLLAEGERRNKRSPDLRYQLAFYYQNKFGITDKVQTLRSLFQLSCIPPGQRSAAMLRDRNGMVDMQAFRKFCEENPHLVRRLKEKLNCRMPMEVVEFLEENRSVPSRFKNDAGDYASDTDQFPVLPPQFAEGPEEWKPSDVGPDDDKSGFRAARAWYAYSLLLVPPSPKWPGDDRPISSASPLVGPPGNPAWDQYDPVRYRLPKSPMLLLFRQGTPRAQSYQADLEEKEGWFDDSGWRPDEIADEANRWFPRSGNEPDAVFGANRSWAGEQWRDAHQRWRAHGEANGLLIEPGRLQALREAAGGEVDSFPVRPSESDLRDPNILRRYAAQMGLFFYDRNRRTTNFPFFLMNSEAEMQPAGLAAHKALWNAELARQSGNTGLAIRRYAEAFVKWKDWLSQYEPYSQVDSLQEDIYEAEYRYLRLLTQDDPQVRNRAKEKYDTLVRAIAPAIPVVPPGDERLMTVLRQEVAEGEVSPFAKRKPNGEPWIKDDVKNIVKARLGVTTKSATRADE